MDKCLRMLKESSKSRFDSYSVRNSVLIISHSTFRDCRVHIFPTTTMMWMLHALWFVVAHDLLEMTSRETSFFCFVQNGARFWKCLWDYFGLRKWKPWKRLSGAIYKKEKWRKGNKKSSWQLENAWTAGNLQNSCLCVSWSLRKTRSFAIVFAIILFWTGEGVGKRLRKTVYK